MDYLKPMLAGKYNGRNVKFPAYVQPKLNGVRCLFHVDSDTAWTRNLKPHYPHIVAFLREMALDVPNHVLDGELMLPKRYSFQDVVSAVKREQDLPLEYHVYDCIDLSHPNASFCDRFVGRLLLPGLSTVPTLMVTAHADIDMLHSFYVSKGHEGLIIRNPKAGYHHGRSQSDLLKYKKMVDAEFPIVGTIEATGKDVRTPVFTCQTKEGKTFNVRPKGSTAYRKQLWKDRDTLIGKLLTVQYQNLSDGGAPIFPVGVAVRDYE